MMAEIIGALQKQAFEFRGDEEEIARDFRRGETGVRTDIPIKRDKAIVENEYSKRKQHPKEALHTCERVE